MDKLIITGGQKISGGVELSGAKNSALPILFASLLSEKEITLKNVPVLSDIHTTLKLCEHAGTCFEWRQKNEVSLFTKKITHSEAPYDLVRTMRASILMLAPLLARTNKAAVSLPGGCAIGARPVDLHLLALESLGAKYKIENGFIHASLDKNFKGAVIDFPFPSVGATETALMAAACADGSTEIKNAAREPEICDLADFLQKITGAKILNAGEENITVLGNPNWLNDLEAITHEIIPDRIEAATYWIAGLITGGAVSLKIQPEQCQSVLDVFEVIGSKVDVEKIDSTDSVITVSSPKNGVLKNIHIQTEPFPGFPTDIQAQLMALLTQSEGTSIIEETIFENRFMHVPELARMGAQITIKGNKAWINPSPENKSNLTGAIVMATDLRASASLIIAGLAAKGTTTIRRIYHLDRGYERIEEKLSSLGAIIHRESE